MGAPGGEWAASIRTGAKEEGACRVELELHCFDLNGTDVSGVCPGQISATENWVEVWGRVPAPLHLPSLNTISIPYMFQELETHPRGLVIHMTFPRRCRAP